jgi:hypothetical protein
MQANVLLSEMATRPGKARGEDKTSRPGKSGEGDDEASQPPDSCDLKPHATPKKTSEVQNEKAASSLSHKQKDPNLQAKTNQHEEETPFADADKTNEAVPCVATRTVHHSKQPTSIDTSTNVGSSDHSGGSEKPSSPCFASGGVDFKKVAKNCSSSHNSESDDSAHDSEEPGAHMVDGDKKNQGTTDRAVSRSSVSNTSATEEPDAQGIIVEEDVVTAWVVPADIEGQQGDLREKVKHQPEGLIGWICGHMVLSGIGISMVIAVVVVTLALLLPSDPNPTPAPSQIPSQNVSDQFMKVVQLIEAQTREPLDIANLSPHQHEALTWLADEDEFVSADPIILVQRYALAAIYYATDGWPEEKCLPFMSKFDHCDWRVATGDNCYVNDDSVDPEDPDSYYDSNSDTIGVSCDDNGYVTSLFLGK